MSNCAVDSANIPMLRAFGALFFIAMVVSIVTGKAYYRRVVERDEEPASYWATVFCYGFLGAFIVGGTLACAVR